MILEYVMQLLEVVQIPQNLMVLFVMIRIRVPYPVSVFLEFVRVLTKNHALAPINVMILEYVILLLDNVLIPNHLLVLVVVMEIYVQHLIIVLVDVVLVQALPLVALDNV